MSIRRRQQKILSGEEALSTVWYNDQFSMSFFIIYIDSGRVQYTHVVTIIR